MSQATIVFIGAGNMASALIAGLIADGTDPQRLIAADPDAAKRESLQAHAGIRTTGDNLAAAREADILVLAVKPQALKDVAIALATSFAP